MFINIAKSKWMKIILFITTFAFVGTAFVALIVYKLAGNIQGIAQVNGREIPVAEFYYHLNLITRQYEAQGIDTAPLKKQLYREAIRNAIQMELLYQEAEKENITATKEEVKQYLLDIEAFKVDGKFSREKYLAYVSDIGLTPKFFEEILRKELSVRHLLAIHRAGFYITEDEIDTFINKQLARITGKFLFIKPVEYKPSEQEIKEYYQKHKDKFSGKKGKLVAVYKIDGQKLGEEKAQQVVKQVYALLKEGKPVQGLEGVEKVFEQPIYGEKPKLPEAVLKEIEKLGENKKIALVSEDGVYYLVKYEKEVYQPQPFEKVKEQIIKAIKKEKAKQEKEKLVKELEQVVKEEKDLNKIAQRYGGKVEDVKGKDLQSLSIEYSIPQSKIGLLTKPSQDKITLVETVNGVLLAKVEKVEPPSKEKKKELENLLKPILLQNKYETLLQMYIDKLEEGSEIIINRRFLQ
ncbi:MAG: hypothetical protein GXN94_04545 [Aquificae bacterium]|nr:hypothetical protein [Aquificota bacterium]